MKFNFLLPLILVLGLSGCAAPYNTNFPMVEKRMTIANVTDLLGKPVSAESGPGESKILFYRLASSPLDTDGSDTREYWVQMQEGVVIGYGERADAATFMRQTMQFESAWNATRTLNDMSRTMMESAQPAPGIAPTVTNCTQMGSTTRCQTK